VFFKVEENIFDFKTHKATRGVVNFYNAGVVNRSGSRFVFGLRVARWFVFKPKILIWGKFSGPKIGKC
jgi:hypothetical protein